MKKKTIIIIVSCVISLFIIFLLINHFVLNKTGVNNSEVSFKDFTFKKVAGLTYGIVEVNNNKYEIKNNDWTANFEILYDEYDHILSYPKCTKKKFIDLNYSILDNTLKDEDINRKLVKFAVTKNDKNNIMLFYKVEEKYIVFVLFSNSDNSFNEEGIETILGILKSFKFSGTKKYDYNSFYNDYYHQCHDIDKYDAEDFQY